MVGAKMLTFFAFCFIAGTILSGIMEGQTALAVTKLTADITAESTNILVVSTTDFLSMDDVYVENEKVRYTSKTATQFNVTQRGLDGTTAVAHSEGARVKNETSNILNSLLGYNVATTAATYGTAAAVVGMTWNIIRSIPRMIAWNYSYLEDGLSIIKYVVLWPISAGFVFALGLIFIGAIQGLFRR